MSSIVKKLLCQILTKDNYAKYCQKMILLNIVKRYLFRFLISNISWNLVTLEEGQLCTWLALKVELYWNLVEYDTLSGLCDVQL